MSKIFKIATTAATFALIVATVSPAHAISEAYRKQLQREHKSQQTEIADNEAEIAAAHTKTFTGGIYEIVTDESCHIRTINGFPPKRLQPHGGKVTVTAQTGDKFDVDVKHCRIFLNANGELTALNRA